MSSPLSCAQVSLPASLGAELMEQGAAKNGAAHFQLCELHMHSFGVGQLGATAAAMAVMALALWAWPHRCGPRRGKGLSESG